MVSYKAVFKTKIKCREKYRIIFAGILEKEEGFFKTFYGMLFFADFFTTGL